MCYKAVVPDNYGNQRMCNQAVDNYVDALEHVTECFRF